MRKKGFTLIELLVVIAIIAMLMAILMPALGRVKRLAQRLVCGTNLKGLGTSCLIYAQENDDEFPVAGGRGTNTWAESFAGWTDPDKNWTGNDDVTISASQYLLVKFADVAPKVFICGSSGEKPFEPIGITISGQAIEVTDVWDFGGDPENGWTDDLAYNHVSYSYHFPYTPVWAAAGSARPLTGGSASGMAVMADKNPWYDKDLSEGTPGADEDHTTKVCQIAWGQSGTIDWDSIPKEEIEVGNSNNHLREGQNIVFMDGHTTFERRPDVGVENDNVYTPYQNPSNWTEKDKRQGWFGVDEIAKGFCKSDGDNWLINDETR